MGASFSTSLRDLMISQCRVDFSWWYHSLRQPLGPNPLGTKMDPDHKKVREINTIAREAWEAIGDIICCRVSERQPPKLLISHSDQYQVLERLCQPNTPTPVFALRSWFIEEAIVVISAHLSRCTTQYDSFMHWMHSLKRQAPDRPWNVLLDDPDMYHLGAVLADCDEPSHFQARLLAALEQLAGDPNRVEGAYIDPVNRFADNIVFILPEEVDQARRDLCAKIDEFVKETWPSSQQ